VDGGDGGKREEETPVHPFIVRDLLADKRCSRAVLDFLSTTDVGRLAKTEEDAGSEMSEWELREREEERRAEAGELVAEETWVRGRNCCSYPSPLPWRPPTMRGGGLVRSPFAHSLDRTFVSFVISLVRISPSWDRPGRRVGRSLQRAATEVRCHNLDRLHASTNKQKKITLYAPLKC